MKYLLDTNVLVHFIRKDATAAEVEAQFSPLSLDSQAIVSIVSFGEIKSIAIQSGWGVPKLAVLDKLLATVLRADLTLDIVERFAEIDAFSQNKLPGKPLGLTSRNMGKNDLWIAATASVLGLRLLITDADFDHLDGVFLGLGKIKLQ